MIVTGPTASVAVAAGYETAAPAELVAATTRSFGTVKAGGVESRTVTVNVLVELFPTPSLAITVTVVSPSAKTDPESAL